MFRIVVEFAIGIGFLLLGAIAVRGGGFIEPPADPPDGEVLAVAAQDDGSAVYGGRFSRHMLLRRDADGTRDYSIYQSWVTGGFNDAVLALATMKDGRLLVAGEFTSFDEYIVGSLVRLNADGSYDLEFSRNLGTGFNDRVVAVAIQSDDKILVAGDFTDCNGSEVNGLARLNSDGSLDDGFDIGSGFDRSVLSVKLNGAGGGILVTGEFTSFDGTPAPRFVRLDVHGKLAR